MMEHNVVTWKQPIHCVGIVGLDIDATYLLKKANKPNPTKSKQSAIDAEHCRPPRSNAYSDDGK